MENPDCNSSDPSAEWDPSISEDVFKVWGCNFGQRAVLYSKASIILECSGGFPEYQRYSIILGAEKVLFSLL